MLTREIIYDISTKDNNFNIARYGIAKTWRININS